MIIGKDELLDAFKKRVSESDSIEVAVAWATVSPALKEVVSFAAENKNKAKVIVGISGSSTQPQALRALQKVSQLRVTDGQGATFHPKFYRFTSGKKSICWVGSANLTKRGFGMNYEAVHEFVDDGKGGEWFNSLWDSLDPKPGKLINDYEEKWTPPSNDQEKTRYEDVDIDHPVSLISNGVIKNWQQYVDAIKSSDAYWASFEDQWHFNVLGEQQSYIDTISTGTIIANSKDWGSLELREINILLGTSGSGGPAYGLLGAMGGAATAVNGLRKDAKLRQHVQSILAPLLKSDDFPTDAATAVAEISRLNRFSSGVATRLIALLRPDMGVSVNKASRRKLAELSGLKPTSLGDPENYSKLLTWVHSQPWHRAPEPKDAFGRTLWAMRAAVIDAFVYELHE